MKKPILLTALEAAACAAPAAAREQPNILVILADDMGYSDIGCYGGLIRTPNLDSLAAHGLRYTQFYNTARSCPSRASLLTGLHPHQTGIGHMAKKQHGEEGYRGDLNDRCVTIAEVLRTAGYATYAVGKWHVTNQLSPSGAKDNWPLQRGFDHFYGTIMGGGSYYDPATLCRGNDYITPENDPAYRPETFYYTDAIADNALQFLATHHDRQAGKPFFMYMAFTAAHWPMQVPEEEKYLNTQKELEAMLVGYLGGRAAEEIVFDSVTTGASNDIEQATKVARAMITQYGMSKKFGLMGLATQENQYLNGRAVLNCGDNTATEVDHEVMELLRVSYEEAKRLISSHRKALDKIAAYLIRKETITGKEFMIIFRAVEKGMEVSDVLDAEGLKALDEAVKAEDKTDEANADTETAESAIAVPAIGRYR
mgnify:CR=1 FL=1